MGKISFQKFFVFYWAGKSNIIRNHVAYGVLLKGMILQG